MARAASVSMLAGLLVSMPMFGLVSTARLKSSSVNEPAGPPSLTSAQPVPSDHHAVDAGSSKPPSVSSSAPVALAFSVRSSA